MDLTFLHSLIQAESLPAPDLWLAGYGMPYYYLGYLTNALVAKATAMDPAVAYNLAVATVLALAASATFGLVASLIRLGGAPPRVAFLFGGLGAFGLTVMGNLQAFCEMLASQGVGDHAFWTSAIKNIGTGTQGFPPTDGGWWFRAARVIPNIQPDGITEFPYFSFLLGDLHPHYMAIPLMVLVAAFSVQQLVAPSPLSQFPMRTAVAAIVLGFVIPLNTWDLPVLWGLFAFAVLAGALRSSMLTWQPIMGRAQDIIGVAFLAVVLYSPYFIGYDSQPLGIDTVAVRTPLRTLLVLFGPLLVLPVLGGLVAAIGEGTERIPPLSERSALNRWAAVVAGGLFFGLWLLGEPTLGLLLGSLVLWTILAWTRVRSEASVLSISTALLTIVGLGSLLVPEVVFLRDSFGTRMNTVFKFYYDGWVLLGIAAPLISYELLAAARTLFSATPASTLASSSTESAPARSSVTVWAPATAAVTLGLSTLLLAAGTVYPIAATWTKVGGFMAQPTLDGMSFLRATRPDDVAAIDWLKQNHPGSGVLEAIGNDYTDAARISTFAGAPTLLGWVGHEQQWRRVGDQIDARRELARRIYTDPNPSIVGLAALPWNTAPGNTAPGSAAPGNALRGAAAAAPRDWREGVQLLGIDFVVVGGLERETYGRDAGSGLDGVLPVVYRSGSTTIFAVRSIEEFAQR
ncbi:MAG: conserved rane protein of unknown function [Chloroflexi bacterium]|nr:conserved rane protein of unknown function [Chloroflexota bacterium]